MCQGPCILDITYYLVHTYVLAYVVSTVLDAACRLLVGDVHKLCHVRSASSCPTDASWMSYERMNYSVGNVTSAQYQHYSRVKTYCIIICKFYFVFCPGVLWPFADCAGYLLFRTDVLPFPWQAMHFKRRPILEIIPRN